MTEGSRLCPHCGVEAATGNRFVTGARVGKYTLVRKIGQGGMGVVFEARHADLDRAVALKVLTLAEVDSVEASRRFRREARLASRLEHPGAVTIHDFFHSPEGMPCLVMELVAGESVRAAIERDGPFPVDRAVRIGEGVLEVLAAAHESGLVHRDITSRNVMLVEGEEERVKVLDFGIAKMVDPGEGTGMTPLTEDGTVLGSPQYMSPEQSRGDPVDGRTDLYSVGIVMYEMLSGHVPFDSTRAMDVLLQQVQADVPPLPSDRVPADVRHILERALKKDPDERHPDAETFRAALAGFRRAHPSGNVTSESTRRAVAARLLPLGGEPAVAIHDRLRLGRGNDCSFVVSGDQARRVSTEHAELFWRGGELWVRDLDSTNGTYLDGRRVTEEPITGSAVLRLARKGPAYRVELVGDRSRLARWIDGARVWLVETSGKMRRIFSTSHRDEAR